MTFKDIGDTMDKYFLTHWIDDDKNQRTAIIDLDGFHNQLESKYGQEWLVKELNRLHFELEELKQSNKELKSNVIDLINKKINKLKNTNKVSVIPRESVEILKELKKELEGDLE